MKVCAHCKEAKDTSCFGKSKKYSDGLWVYCKECTNARAKAYRESSPDKVRDSLRLFRANNASKIAAKKKQYRERNREKVSLSRKLSYDKNRDYELLKAREYKRNNPHIVRALCAKYSAAKLMSMPSWCDIVLIQNLHKEASRLSLETGIKWHVDHIVPLRSKKVCGLHWHGNMQLLPASVNQSKSNRHWPDMP